MTEIEQQALALWNEVRAERGLSLYSCADRKEGVIDEALCRAIEQLEAERTAHAATKAEAEAFKREVSDAVFAALADPATASHDVALAQFYLRTFILPKPVDPLVEAFDEIHGHQLREGEFWSRSIADRLRAALASRGLEIRPIGENAA